MALAIGAPQSVSPELTMSIAQRLASDVANFGDSLRLVFRGLRGFCRNLISLNGERAMKTMMGDQYPSLGTMAAQNMTSLCENLACSFHTAGGGSQNRESRSLFSLSLSLQSFPSPPLTLLLARRAHHLSSVSSRLFFCVCLRTVQTSCSAWDAWFSASLGGIDSKVNGSTGGWKIVIARVAPSAITMLGSGKAVQETIRGTVSLAWSFDAATKKLTMDLTLPLGSTAEVHTPSVLDFSSTKMASINARCGR